MWCCAYCRTRSCCNSFFCCTFGRLTCRRLCRLVVIFLECQDWDACEFRPKRECALHEPTRKIFTPICRDLFDHVSILAQQCNKPSSAVIGTQIPKYFLNSVLTSSLSSGHSLKTYISLFIAHRRRRWWCILNCNHVVVFHHVFWTLRL